MDKIVELIKEMTFYEKGCPERINHFLKVYSFAVLISDLENLDEDMKFLIKAAAIVHDIGIKPSLEKYNSSAGSYQQTEGPPLAEKMLKKIGFDDDTIKRVCWLVAHHHTYTSILEIDYQILVEADFLVNIFEEHISKESAVCIKQKYFKTQSSKMLFDNLYAEFL